MLLKITDMYIQSQIIAALQYYADHGVSTCALEEAIDRFDLDPPEAGPQDTMSMVKAQLNKAPDSTQNEQKTFLGKSEAYEEALRLANQANNLEELSSAILEFDGIGLKKTAGKMVFAAGNPKADIMLVGEAPEADEDRQGIPFVGASGQLLDRILSCIDIDRNQNEPQKSVYISNILNWRPPGNRTPSPAEIEVSLPFIERHIRLVSPKILVICAGVAAKALLASDLSISRLRNKWHDYVSVTQGLEDKGEKVKAIVTYHPSHLLKTPAQKKLVWEDMLSIKIMMQKIMNSEQ